MQEAMNKLEMKLRREIEELEKDYQKKIDKLSTEKNQQELYFNEQIKNIRVCIVNIYKLIQIFK